MTTEDLTHQWQLSSTFEYVDILMGDNKDSGSPGNVLAIIEYYNGITINENQLGTPPYKASNVVEDTLWKI